MENEMREERINGEKVVFADNAESGFRFLDRLNSEESEVFFYYARNRGKARFNGDYYLSYESGDFTITKR